MWFHIWHFVEDKVIHSGLLGGFMNQKWSHYHRFHNPPLGMCEPRSCSCVPVPWYELLNLLSRRWVLKSWVYGLTQFKRSLMQHGSLPSVCSCCYQVTTLMMLWRSVLSMRSTRSGRRTHHSSMTWWWHMLLSGPPWRPSGCLMSPGMTLTSFSYLVLLPRWVPIVSGVRRWRKIMRKEKETNMKKTHQSCYRFIALSSWANNTWLELWVLQVLVTCLSVFANN